VLQERALADARLAPHYEHTMLPGPHGIEQFVERAALLGAPDQFGWRTGRPEVEATVDARDATPRSAAPAQA